MKKYALIAVLILATMASACSLDMTDPEAVDAEGRSPYWRLASWENVKLTWAGMIWTETSNEFRVTVRGSALVRNLAYHKNIAIRYTTDGWKTWKEARASYAGTGENNSEFWNYETPVFVYRKSSPTQSFSSAVKLNFQFAVRYTVNGKTYWDSNGGKNYLLNATKTYISNY